MARHLAIDWDYQQLRVVAATVRGSELRLEQAAVWEEEQSPNIAEAAALGQRLRERLKSAGLAPAPVLVCVGRDRVILREVRYPSVAAAEEPAVIRFQVLKELTDSAADVIYVTAIDRLGNLLVVDTGRAAQNGVGFDTLPGNRVLIVYGVAVPR